MAIEIHTIFPQKRVVNELIRIKKVGLMHKRTIDLILSGPIKQRMEFETKYKLYQFLQLVKLFKMRKLNELHH